ncbi:MAG: HYR domain-containing protein [Dehalococcoidia bacterium]|nr:MAG: HYR domain-containing protein [Dehalococcoidia bacterium]
MFSRFSSHGVLLRTGLALFIALAALGATSTLTVRTAYAAGDATCDYVDDDLDGAFAEDCSAVNPTNIGASQLVTVDINGQGPNATVAPGAALTISGSTSLTPSPYCPGCVRQLYISVAPNPVVGTPSQGSFCKNGLGTYSTSAFTAPTVDGTYLILGRVNLDYVCYGGYWGGTVIGTLTVDTAAPVITVPSAISTPMTSAAGASVTYSASANDAIDGDIPVSCAPPSGSTFAAGTTTVHCSAADAAGHPAEASFSVTVTVPAETCDYIDNNFDGLVDEGCIGVNPTNIGASQLVTVNINGQGPNATVAPGAALTISGNTSLTPSPYCPGCVRQLYISIAPNPVTGTPSQGSFCKNGLGSYSTSAFTAPTTPGTYYVLGRVNLDYFCYGGYWGGTLIGTFKVLPASTTTVTFGPGPFVYNGSAFTATASVSPSGTATITYTGDCTNAGSTCRATATFAGSPTLLPSTATATITIAKAPTTTAVTFGAGPFAYTGSPFSATATVSPSAAGSATIAYTGDCTNAGTSCTATATYTESANYLGSTATETITIAKAPTTTAVTFGAGPFVYTGSAFSATATVSPAAAGTASIAYTGDCTNAGTCTATATYAESANYLGSTATGSITVTYAICAAGGDTSPAKNSGSTIPVKVKVCTAGGANAGSTALVVKALGISPSASLADSGKANPGDVFRFDDGQYIFNLSTKGFAAGAYTLDYTVGNDPTVYHYAFVVRVDPPKKS